MAQGSVALVCRQVLETMQYELQEDGSARTLIEMPLAGEGAVTVRPTLPLDTTTAILRTIIAEQGVTMIVLGMCGWDVDMGMSAAKAHTAGLHVDDVPEPWNHPSRFEMIFAAGYNRAGQFHALNCRVHRSALGIGFGEAEQASEVNLTGGIMEWLKNLITAGAES